MAHGRKFWNRHAARYAKSPVADEESYQQKLRVTREYLDADMEVLEFGCGTGSTALVHAPFVKHIHAFDISSRMIEIARAKLEASNVMNVDFDAVAIEDLHVPDRSLDAVLGLNILNLLVDRDAAIAKVWAMLKPGGVFVSSTVCLGETMKFFKLVGPVGEFFGLLPPIRIFTSQQLITSLSDGGFVIEHQWQPAKDKAIFVVARKPEA
ncbi:MAG: class I SAM-dependent methyltransferase [Rhodospirillaceae bacterium]|jgi:2-polyprenyl-3-methyl-5-hydroxy-6-metoxy-1,4-benzoquinol methylase|nr:class I SAM-dependent methyltransferase [Rhodospirillaceae bacterium]MBT6405479.1 class I SAM-dependent methyltransferase [Rhodospirillaceae bacterium]MBT7362948.1 class I SAM-dependent methyltransferase [Rhodospirillaceae bacterium]